jgi:hypothetical protein
LLKNTAPTDLFIIISPFASNETIENVVELATNKIKTTNIGYIGRIDDNFADDFLKTNTKSPNTNGLIAKNIFPINVSDLTNLILSKKIKTILSIEEDYGLAQELAVSFAKLKYLFLATANHNKAEIFANVILPTAHHTEYTGTFTNTDNIIQSFTPVVIASDILSPVDILKSGIHQSRLEIFGAKNDK